MYVSGKIELRDREEGTSVCANKPFARGEIILAFEQNFLQRPRIDTLCIDMDKHQYSTNPNAAENFLNHSCDPNGYIDFETLTYRALRPIKKGEELTFNYLTTEWDMANKFVCKCGSENCYENIHGFTHLTLAQKHELAPLLSPFLKKKLHEETSNITDT